MATDLGDFLQIGFFEGAIPWPPANFYSTSPKVVTEADSTCFGKQWYVRSTPAPNPRYNEYFGLRWAGQTGTCGGSQVCFWYWERGGNFAGFDVTFLRGCQGIYIAQTEHFDNTHMEPNSTQCFGAAGCTPPNYGYDLWLWNQTGGYFYLWTDPLPQPIITDSNHGNPPAQYGNGYTLDYLQDYYEFRTHGQWP